VSGLSACGGSWLYVLAAFISNEEIFLHQHPMIGVIWCFGAAIKPHIPVIN
jgi:hypothetical protein